MLLQPAAQQQLRRLALGLASDESEHEGDEDATELARDATLPLQDLLLRYQPQPIDETAPSATTSATAALGGEESALISTAPSTIPSLHPSAGLGGNDAADEDVEEDDEEDEEDEDDDYAPPDENSSSEEEEEEDSDGSSEAEENQANNEANEGIEADAEYDDDGHDDGETDVIDEENEVATEGIIAGAGEEAAQLPSSETPSGEVDSRSPLDQEPQQEQPDYQALYKHLRYIRQRSQKSLELQQTLQPLDADDTPSADPGMGISSSPAPDLAVDHGLSPAVAEEFSAPLKRRRQPRNPLRRLDTLVANSDGPSSDSLTESETESESELAASTGPTLRKSTMSIIKRRRFGMSSNFNVEPGVLSGSTANVVFIRRPLIYVANVGDSRCVLSRGGEAVDLSKDHTPEDPVEIRRIHAAGGVITMGRVNGALNLTRAIGDHQFKRTAGLSLADQAISSLADVTVHEIDQTDEFLVIACDGIWNSLSSQQVVDFVRSRLADRMPLTEIVSKLLTACLASSPLLGGAGLDNETAIIVLLKPDPTFLPDPTETVASRSSESESPSKPEYLKTTFF
eukprot:m.604125 g.604125  ORF g.604125 m.604125 type:complete len:570 (+) comp58105_c0_seq31:348-2057(+)